MRNHRARTQLFASPEALFISGGEEMSPIYPQPGITDEERWSHCSAYMRGEAAIEDMQNNDLIRESSMSEIFSLRDERFDRITERVVGAADIEQARQRIANAFNAMNKPSSLDQQR
jgi:hypothetical protein